MQFEWDEEKQLSNLAKHGLDFEDVARFFENKPILLPTHRNEELRFVATGLLDNRFISVIITMRVSVIRIISMRRARDAEISHYRRFKKIKG